MGEFTVREYREGDEVEINQRFNEVFAASRSLEEWRWKFTENPTHARIIAIAEAEGVIVGQYSAVTAYYQCGNRVVPVSVPADNFVVPHFRGGLRGVQKELFEFHRSLSPLWPRSISFGFPNRAAYIIGKRMLTYLDLGQMPVLFLRLNLGLAASNRFPWIPSWLSSLIRRAGHLWLTMSLKCLISRVTPAIGTRISSQFDTRFDALWNRVKSKYGILCVRDCRYLNWRYSKPGGSYRIVVAESGDEILGYAVTGLKREAEATAGFIVDLFGDDSPEIHSALVREAILDLLARNADYVLCWMLPDKAAFRALREIGFALRESAFPPVNIVYRILDPRIDRKFGEGLRNWYLTMGDSDIY